MDYLRRRSEYSEKLHVPDELTALSYHLKRNLWLEDRYDIVRLADDISCDLDAAMTVRRDGIPGKRTPDGILTKFAGTSKIRLWISAQVLGTCPKLDGMTGVHAAVAKNIRGVTCGDKEL
jgi:hypothetical protein